MSREKAKEILYKHEEKNHGAINHWQAAWILDAMIEYNESIVKSNSVLGDVMICDNCDKNIEVNCLCEACLKSVISKGN